MCSLRFSLVHTAVIEKWPHPGRVKARMISIAHDDLQPAFVGTGKTLLLVSADMIQPTNAEEVSCLNQRFVNSSS